MDKKQKSNVGAILANMGKKFFVSKAYWIPAFAGMTNTGILQLAPYAAFFIDTARRRSPQLRHREPPTGVWRSI